MKLKYVMTCYDEDADKFVAQVSSYSETGMLEESGKRKWTDTIKRYEDEQKSPIREEFEVNEAEQESKAERDAEMAAGL